MSMKSKKKGFKAFLLCDSNINIICLISLIYFAVGHLSISLHNNFHFCVLYNFKKNEKIRR